MNTLPPEVSIVIPAYNVAAYVGETLDSVFAQTFTDFEVIIVNDGSPDTKDFERVLDPYIDRIRYLKQENLGASAARNAGLLMAEGAFVAFLDADDIWLPHYLEHQLRFIREHDVDFVCADAVVFGDSSVDEKTYMEALMETAPPTGPVTFLGLVSAAQSLITSGVVARRTSVLEVGLFDEALRNAQDYDLWLRLARHGTRMAYQRQVLLRYRRHDDSLSGSPINIHRRELRVYDKIQQSYGLTAAERAEVIPVIADRRAMLEFELGKLYLAQGDFPNARDSFSRANHLRPSWKTRIAHGSARVAPRLMRAISACHLSHVESRRKVQSVPGAVATGSQHIGHSCADHPVATAPGTDLLPSRTAKQRRV
jgi:glycosyltransferase involved in cell wall biosynthesis